MDEILIMLENKIEELILKLKEFKDYKEKVQHLEKENAELKEKLNTVLARIESLVNKIKEIES
ncbi:MAG: hypothetical protein ABIM85_02950 [candidate division WOR-3 bacterium]